ncbi:MAG TPA: polysaccharide biosynthesis tyrosine autokinase [Propionibacteriaceae bacterium]|nr:polysaccharide biosynthesis tyrosine autokinase [Propionibacteriaceae bacterium]
MEPRDYLSLLRRRWRSIVLVALATLAATAAMTFLPTPQYTASAQLFFGVPGGESANDLASGSTFTERQMTSYARVATSPIVLEPVIDELDLTTTTSALATRVTATAPLDTVILEISATDFEPDQAARIANAVGEQVASVVGDLVPQRSNVPSVRATIFARAEPPLSPSKPRVPLNLAMGTALALVLGVGSALLRHALDSRIRSEQDVTDMTNSAILGVVPLDSNNNSVVAMHADPGGARSEAVRRLRANLRFNDLAQQVKSIVITSSIPREGKSTTAVNLAVAMADTGSRVVLVDTDLRAGTLGHLLAGEGGVGLSDVLAGDATLASALRPARRLGLDILPAGQLPPNPSELLESDAMSSVIKELSAAYDMVLLDSPPLLPVSDALVISKAAGGTLLVVGVDRIHRPELRASLESLSTVDANLLGLVLNKIARRDTSAYVYDAGYPTTWEVPASPQGSVHGEAERPRPEQQAAESGKRVPSTEPPS